MTTCSRCGHAESEHRWFAMYRRVCIRFALVSADTPTGTFASVCGCSRFVR